MIWIVSRKQGPQQSFAYRPSMRNSYILYLHLYININGVNTCVYNTTQPVPVSWMVWVYGYMVDVSRSGRVDDEPPQPVLSENPSSSQWPYAIQAAM